MNVVERTFDYNLRNISNRNLSEIYGLIFSKTPWNTYPLRFMFNHLRKMSVTLLENMPNKFKQEPVFNKFQQNFSDNKFRVVLIIPTGLGCSIGGHAGDAGPVSKLLSSVCDQLITHPNVVNASDINEMSDNTLYTEGYLLSRYLCGDYGLKEVLQNRVLVVVDGRADSRYIDATINAVNAARSSYGFKCSEVLVLNNFPKMKSMYSGNNRAIGSIENLEPLFDQLVEKRNEYDAIALTSLIDLDQSVRDYYYNYGGVNPWGGVEAMLTHAISHLLQVPCAHAPMMESEEVETLDYGVIDPRDAAEIVSLTYLQSVLKGLNKAPRFDFNNYHKPDCLVIPKDCLGLPHFAALDNNIPIIAVENPVQVVNDNIRGFCDYIDAKSYLEVAGIISSLRSGIDLESLRRPIRSVKVSVVKK